MKIFRLAGAFVLSVVAVFQFGCGSTGILESNGSGTSYKSLDLTINGCYHGFFAIDNETASSFTTLAGKAPAIVGIFVPFLVNGSTVLSDSYASTFSEMVTAGMVPYITWEPMDSAWGTLSSYPTGQNILQKIVSGNYDIMINNWADRLKAIDSPVIIRFAHEMNGNWYPWSADATLYKSAFRSLVSKFRARGAYNVMWVFAPNHDAGGTTHNYQTYFPGADVVDMTGISGYNWGFGSSQPSWSTWVTFSALFQSMVGDLTSLYGLPIILDLASTEVGGSKATWITDMMSQLSSNGVFSKVKAFCWFQANKETDWRINSGTTNSSRSAYSTAISGSYFYATPVVVTKTTQ